MLNRIAVIDDSEPDLLYTRIVLERAAVAREVCAFDDARVALAWLLSPEGDGVDLILLDINMPGMDGFGFLAALQQARACQAGQGLGKVMMLSSSPDPDDRARAAAFPCVRGYLVKPLDRVAAAALADLALD